MKKLTKNDFSKPCIVREKINNLRRIDLSSENVTLELLHSFVGEIFRELHISEGKTIFEKVYRARINQKNTSFKTIQELWYPKPEKVVKYGRINDIGKSCFYCSSSEGTAVTEIGAKIGDTVTVLTCIPKAQNVAPITMELGLLELTDIEIKDNKSRVPFARLPIVADYLSPRGVIVNEIIRKFLVDEFTKEVPRGQEYKYKIAICIAEIFFKLDTLDALVYPSIPTAFKGLNYAFKPDSADSLLVPVAVQELTIAEILPPNLDGSGARYGAHYRNALMIGDDGVILWAP